MFGKLQLWVCFQQSVKRLRDLFQHGRIRIDVSDAECKFTALPDAEQIPRTSQL